MLAGHAGLVMRLFAAVVAFLVVVAELELATPPVVGGVIVTMFQEGEVWHW